ncbi:MAG: asparaginase domain-containing protein [Methylococcales bacterium]|nr:asparaginase domain-containing protein [Methylococcales bacterium]
MKNILLVFTGGTIGSTVSEGTINTSGHAPRALLRHFQQHDDQHQQVHFTIIEPLQLLSENLSPKAWQTLIVAIEAQQPDNYDGIIITHGTDTLAYTAAALSFYFNGLNKPLLLVASNYPLADPRANGHDNFSCAVEFIRQNPCPGVFVPYRNPLQAMHVHHGTRLGCSLQLSGDFFSVQGLPFMQFENRQFLQMQPPTPVFDREAIALNPRFSERVLMIRPYPGLNYDHINLENVDAVLHDLYHSGTACVSDEWGGNYSLVHFINRCTALNIAVYLAPAVKSADAYHSTKALLGQGAFMLWNLSIEAAYVKLMLAYGNFRDIEQIRAFMDKDVAGEHV